MRDERQGPLPALLLALTVLAGVVDAVSILSLGHVFVATMTGNLVFIGLALAGAQGFAVGTSALAIGGFVVGVLMGGRACRAAGAHRGRALRNVLGLKLWLAGIVTLIAVLSGPSLPVGARDAMVVLLAMSMGAQLAAIRYIKVPDLLTVVLTMTIIGSADGERRRLERPGGAAPRPGAAGLRRRRTGRGAARPQRQHGGGAVARARDHPRRDDRRASGVPRAVGLVGAAVALNVSG